MPAYFERLVREDVTFPCFSRRYECDRCSAHAPVPGPCLICCDGRAVVPVGTVDEVAVHESEE